MKNTLFSFLVLFIAQTFSQVSLAQGTDNTPDLNQFRLHTNKTIIKPGESISITVQWLNDLLAPLEKDASEDNSDLLEPLVKTSSQDMSDLLAPLVKTSSQDMSDLLAPLVQENADSESWVTLSKDGYKSIKWEIGSGPGKITASASAPVTVVFTAPLQTPTVTTYITATITGLAKTPLNGASAAKTVVKLTIPIMIIKSDQYVIYGFDGKTHRVYGDGETGAIYHKPGEAFSLKVTMSGNRELLILTDDYSKGFFHYGNEEKQDRVAEILVNAGVAKENKKYGTSYSVSDGNCNNCKTKYSAGGVRITKIEEVGEEVKLTKAEEAALKNGTASEALYNKLAQQVGSAKRTYVEGSFQGVVFLIDGKDPKPIFGKFRVAAW